MNIIGRADANRRYTMAKPLTIQRTAPYGLGARFGGDLNTVLTQGSLMVEPQPHKLVDGSSTLPPCIQWNYPGNTLEGSTKYVVRPAGCIEYGGTMPPVNYTSRDVKGDTEMKRSDSNV